MNALFIPVAITLAGLLTIIFIRDKEHLFTNRNVFLFCGFAMLDYIVWFTWYITLILPSLKG